MRAVLTARSAGLGVLDVLAKSRHLTVVGSFSSGVYLQGNDGLFALSSAAIPKGPLHAIVDRSPPPIAVGTRVGVCGNRLEMVGIHEGGGVGVGDVLIDFSAANIWSPALPTLEEASVVVEALLKTVPELRFVPPELAAGWSGISAAAASGAARELRRLVEGRGSGLTPVGDDVLAGWLIADCLVKRADHDTAARLALTAELRSTDLSRAFADWAARGQSIAPVHHLLDAAAQSDTQSIRSAVDEVVLIGATSGRALLSGLGLGLTRERLT